MNFIDKKKLFVMFLLSLTALILAFSLDQYYIYNQRLNFLLRPLNIINTLLQSISGKQL